MDLSFLNLKRQPPLVRYGALLIFFIAWYALMYSPIESRIELQKTTIEAQELKIGRLKRRINRLKNIDQTLSLEKKKLEQLKGRLVPGDTIQMVATNIQDSFLKKASKNDINVLVYRSGRPRKWRSYKLAVAIFNLKTNIVKLVHFLEDFYSDKRLQRINNINVSTMRGKEKELRVNLEVEALFLGDRANQ